MDLVGKILAGRYEIREEIGKGGMALVYRAWCNLLNRYVAIKVLKEEFKDDKEFVRRFNVEAQAAARISNPHVVSIYDVGYEDGLYYIVMECIEGITLKEYIAEKGKLSWREAVSFGAQIAEGLDAAHKNQVIHRDIKPQNIIIASDGVLKVTDFGIARATNSQATMTMANTAIGTVHYLSPEQARGGYTDARTDIYSLGVVLYEMLTGKLPFTDDSPVAVAIKHIQESPTPLRELNPRVPESVAKVTMRAMSKDPEERYGTAGAFQRDLRQVLIDPNGELNLNIGGDPAAEEMDSTIEMSKIDEDTLDKYNKKPSSSTDDYAKYAKEIDREVEDRKLREMNDKRQLREQKKKERRVTLIAIFSAILVVAVLGTAFFAMTGGMELLKGSETIQIPNLVDMDLTKARQEYGEQFSIVPSRTEPQRQSDKPAGTILEQSPEANKEVTKSEDIVISVVVSSGNTVAETTLLGEYRGVDVATAQKALTDAGFMVVIEKVDSDPEQKDKVIGQNPPAGEVSKGSVVTLEVGKGTESAQPTASATATATATKDPEPSASATATATATKNPTESSQPTQSNTPTRTPDATTQSGGTATGAPSIGD